MDDDGRGDLGACARNRRLWSVDKNSSTCFGVGCDDDTAAPSSADGADARSAGHHSISGYDAAATSCEHPHATSVPRCPNDSAYDHHYHDDDHHHDDHHYHDDDYRSSDHDTAAHDHDDATSPR